MEIPQPHYWPGNMVLIKIDSVPTFTTIKTATWLEEKKQWSYTLNGFKGHNFSMNDFVYYRKEHGVILF